MCGHVGVAGNLATKEEKTFKDLLFMDQLRGAHSTGVVHVDRNLDPHIIKEAIPATIFLEWSPFKDALRKVSNKVLIGHNRYATMGELTAINAHPFKHGEIYGAHNGTLRNQSLLPDHQNFEVDSDNIYHSINKIGIQETISKLHGAYALVWWDNESETLNFVRNSERTLFFTVINGTLFWASEKGMLITALDRNKYEDYEIHDVKEDLLYTFDVNQTIVGGVVVIEKPRVSAVTPYVPPKPSTNVVQYRGNRGNTSTGHSTNIGRSTVKKEMEAATKEAGYGGLSDIKWYFKEYELRSGVAVFESLDTQALTLRVTGVTKIRGEGMEEETDKFYIVTDAISVVRQNGKVSRLIAKYEHLIAKDWEHFMDDISEDDVDQPTPMIEDHMGVMIAQESFDRRYGNCCVCSSPLYFNDDLKMLFSHNEGACGDCNSDPQHNDILSFVRR